MNFDNIRNSIDWHRVDPFNWSKVGAFTTTLLTIFIAGAAVHVAYQQYVTNKRHLRLALFEKRLAVYESVTKFRSLVLRGARVDLNQLNTFVNETRNHQFLFGKDVSVYIDEIYHKGVKVWEAKQPPIQPASSTEVLIWFSKERLPGASF